MIAKRNLCLYDVMKRAIPGVYGNGSWDTVAADMQFLLQGHVTK